MNKKMNAAIFVIIAIAVTIIASLIITKFSNYGLIVCGIILFFTLGEIASIYFMKKHVLYRKQNIFAIISIMLLTVIIIIAMIDLTYGSYVFPEWCLILGAILLFTGNYVLITALIAQPRHGKIEYNEDEVSEDEYNLHGPYDVVRHPINLAAFLLAVSLPLVLGSAWAFIASGLTIIVIIVHAVTVENFRFENYKWYYDYTKQVPFMMFPLIW